MEQGPQSILRRRSGFSFSLFFFFFSPPNNSIRSVVVGSRLSVSSHDSFGSLLFLSRRSILCRQARSARIAFFYFFAYLLNTSLHSKKYYSAAPFVFFFLGSHDELRTPFLHLCAQDAGPVYTRRKTHH